jgi:hypothetical protein
MDEHAVVTAAWAEHPIYCRIVPWSERILGMTRSDAMTQRERYSRGEVWCECVSEVFPEGFSASIDINSMRAITEEEFNSARDSFRLRAAGVDDDVALTGRGRRGSRLWRRLAAAS